MALTVFAAYDIHEDNTRARVAALLQKVGDRVQKSVFLLTVAPEDLDDVLQGATHLIDPHVDSLYVISQCQTCYGSMLTVGQAHPPTEEFHWAAW